jgi:hypothetical protein
MNEQQFSVLKGRHLIAQGKRRRSVALGWRTGLKIVRGKGFIQEDSLVRTKWINPIFLAHNIFYSVRKELFALFIESSRTVFLLHHLPRVAFRIVPPETLPWAIMFWPFRPEKFAVNL